MIINAFIFARGGSKGLPGKNIKPLNGKPMIAYAIEVALQSERISKVYVSTDDTEIARVARQFGALVIERPDELAQDKSAEWDAWRHAVEYVQQETGQSFDLFVSLPTTSPLRAEEDVHNAIDKLLDAKADICIGVTPANRSPYFNMVKKNQDESVELVAQPSGDVLRRQDAPVVYDITTVVYATRPDFIMKNRSLFAGRLVSVEVPKERAVDIDDIYDFKYAEAIMRGSE